jgi:FAD/FMN-containing dehydrogenase
MSTPDTAPLEVAALRDRIAGDAVTAADSAWDSARAAFNLAADQRPAAVVLADRAEDVAATVEFARQRGLRVAPQGPGHGATLLPSLDRAVLLRTSRMAGVAVDAESRTARAGAGALWSDVVPPAAEHGLAGLHGSSGTVGVTGYTVGGGVGWLSRKHGFASSAVVRFEVVTADGQLRTIDAANEPDLFWALRGGGGAFAIVTGLEFGLVELREVYAGQLMWPLERAADVVAAFREWTASAPRELSAAIKQVRFPPLPVILEPLRGRELVAVGVAFLGDEEAGREAVAPMRHVGPRYLDTVATIPASALPLVAGDPPDPVPAQVNGLALGELPPAATDAYLELAGPEAQTPLVFLELRLLGGALAESSPDHGAADSIDAAYVLYGVGLPIPPEAIQAISDAFARIKERMAPWTSKRTLLNFAEDQPGTRDSFPPAAADRLARVKAAYDPDGIILANHAID